MLSFLAKADLVLVAKAPNLKVGVSHTSNRFILNPKTTFTLV
jgi:hypothetical protein